MALVAEDLGVSVADIRMDTVSRDTKDQARNIASVVGKAPFALVTTAAHMPRTMALFRKVGTNPLPAPTEFKVQKQMSFSPRRFFPKSDALEKIEDTVHEYIGMIWAKLRGQI